ncbi:416_t:CDS:1, partial [Acaulospora colombiana]
TEILNFSEVDCSMVNFDDHGKLILEQFTRKISDLLDCILITAQNLMKPVAQKTRDIAEKEDADRDQMSDNYIRDEHNLISDVINKLNLKAVVEQFGQIHSQLYQFMDNEQLGNDECRSWIACLLQRVFPFMDQYNNVVLYYLTSFLFHQKSLCKLGLVLCNSFATIFTKGFCTPETSTVEDTESGEIDENLQGTGIGEGEGSKDVSNEIEDEEQVLGTQNEAEFKSSGETDVDKKDGIEMENDFDGILEDVEQSIDEEDQTEDEETKSDLEEQVGQLDNNDPEVVDEKMWGENPDDIEDSGKTADSNKHQSPQQDSDIVAKEDSKERSEGNAQEPQMPEQNSDRDMEENELEKFAEDQLEEEYNEQETQFDTEVPQAETLDLPDDMEIDDGGHSNDPEDDGVDDDFRSEMDLDNPNREVEQESPQGEIETGQDE